MLPDRNPIFVVRHGRTRWNEEHRLQGISDIDVSEGGLTETEESARFFARQEIAAIWSSPLKRCLRLVNAIREFHPRVTLEVVPDLMEQNFGFWEGLTKAEILQKYPREWQAYLEDKFTVAPPGGECFRDLEARALRAFQRAQDARRPIALVTHYNVICALFAFLENVSPATLSDMPYPPGTIARVEQMNPQWRAYCVFRPNSGKWFRA
ncbi:MAG: histidine phosphatase family protein [bacterium JZ-2024 1]